MDFYHRRLFLLFHLNQHLGRRFENGDALCATGGTNPLLPVKQVYSVTSSSTSPPLPENTSPQQGQRVGVPGAMNSWSQPEQIQLSKQDEEFGLLSKIKKFFPKESLESESEKEDVELLHRASFNLLPLQCPFYRLHPHLFQEMICPREWFRSQERWNLSTRSCQASHSESGSLKDEEFGLLSKIKKFFPFPAPSGLGWLLQRTLLFGSLSMGSPETKDWACRPTYRLPSPVPDFPRPDTDSSGEGQGCHRWTSSYFDTS